MNTVEILSLPHISFSHVYKTEAYHNRFVPRKNFLEITYIAEGACEMQWNDTLFQFKKGDVICNFHDTDTVISAGGYHCHYTIGTVVEWAPAADEQSGFLLPIATSAEHNTAGIFHLMDNFIHKQFLYKANPSKGAAKLLELFCAIDDCNRKSQDLTIPGSELYTQRAKKYIQKNLYTNITQQSVAEHLGISPGYLCNVFKETEGMTVMRYINTLKMESIKALMENENVRLYEAAAAYGYNDPNYVSRLFKQYFGYNITDKPPLHPSLQIKHAHR